MTSYKTETKDLPSTYGEFWSIKELEKYLMKNSEDGVSKIGKIPREAKVNITMRSQIYVIFSKPIDNYDSELDGKHS